MSVPAHTTPVPRPAAWELPALVPDEGVPDDEGSRYAVLDVLNGIAKGPLRAHFYDLGSKRGFKLVAIRRPDDAGRDF